MRGVVSIAAGLLLAGCSGNAQLIEALAKDPASNCVRITSVYGTVLMSRSNLSSGSLTCNGDGLTIKSDSTTAPGTPQGVYVPVQVVPLGLAPLKP